MPAVTTAIVIASIAAIAIGGGGFVLGRATGPDPSAALAEQTRAIEAQGAALATVAEAAGRPVVIDAELRATLAEVPVQCQVGAGGDPLGVACQWATCLQFGQSAAQRPECRAVEALMVETLAGCPEDAGTVGGR